MIFYVYFSFHLPACTSVNCLRVITSPTPCAVPYAYWTLTGLTHSVTTFAFCLGFVYVFLCIAIATSCLHDFSIILSSMSFLVTSNMAFWSLCASTLLVPLNTCSSVSSLVFWLQLVLLLFQSSYCPHYSIMNCSLNLISFFIFTLIFFYFRCPIHPSSLSFLLLLPYSIAAIVFSCYDEA